MFKLLKLQIFLALCVVALVVGLVADQVLLKPRVEQAIESAVTSNVAGTTGVRAHISSFPFLPRILVTQTVPSIEIDAATTRPNGVRVPLRSLRVVVEDVHLDVSAALKGNVRISSVGAGTARAEIDEADLSSLLGIKGISVRLEVGAAVVAVAGVGVAQLVVAGDRIELRGAGRRIASAPIPQSDLLPCAPELSFGVGRARLTCTFTQVPPALLARLQPGASSP